MKFAGYFGKKRCLAPIFLFLFPLLIFSIELRYIGAGDTIPNELLPISIIYERDFDFNEFVTDSNKLPYYFHNAGGRIVSSYPIIPGLLNLPIYLVGHILGVNLMEERLLLSMLTTAIVSSISVVFMYLCLMKVCTKQRTAVLFALTYAFGTCVWSIASRGIYQHGPSLLFITISMYLILNNRKDLVPYSGFFLGMAVFNRPANIFIALPLTLFIFLYHRNGLKKYIVSAGIPALFLCLYSYLHWGSIISLGQGQGVWGLTGSFWNGFTGILFSPSRGLFVFSPIFIFGFGYLFYALFSRKIEPIYKYFSICVIFFVLLYSKWHMWWGGHCFGYRLLIEVIPMLMIFLAVCWEKVIAKRWYLKTIFMCFLTISIYIHFLGAYCYPSGFNSSPNDIDQHVERLWNFKDTEITRCTIKLLGKLHLRGSIER